MTPPRDPLAYDPDADEHGLDDLAAVMAAAPGREVPDVLAALLARPTWHARAACRGMGTATFFPERGHAVDPARAVCAECPVASPCADAGMTEAHGIWGGLTGADRRQRRRAA